MKRYILTSLALGVLFAIGSAAPASAGINLANGAEMGGLSLDGVILPDGAE